MAQRIDVIQLRLSIVEVVFADVAWAAARIACLEVDVVRQRPVLAIVVSFRREDQSDLGHACVHCHLSVVLKEHRRERRIFTAGLEHELDFVLER